MDNKNVVFKEGEAFQDHITVEQITEYVGKQITVWSGKTIRNSFDTQLSVAGILEKHSENPQCRVLINTGSYTYFMPADVIEFGHYAAPQKFKDGSECVLRIKI